MTIPAYKNEFGESLSDEELRDLCVRIRKLSDSQIDELWFLCEFIYSYRDEGFKAINKEYLERIRNHIESAKQVVIYLWDETRTADIRKNLKIIENLSE